MLDLGTIELRAGATLVVAARINDGPAVGATVSAVPAEQDQELLNAIFARNIRSPPSWEPPTARGSVAFVGVPPGVLHVVATGTDCFGLAGPFELVAGEETEVDDLPLRAASTVEVTILGDRSWLKTPLQLAARPGSELGVAKDMDISRFFGATDATLTIPVPGRWFFELRSGGMLLDRQPVDVAPETTTSVQLSVERLRFRGRVFLGEEPIAGSLSLMRPGTEETLATVETEPDGRFATALPEGGMYTAVFRRPQDGILNARGSAQFTPGIETMVRLRSTSLSGHVVFGDGRPAGDANVTVERLIDTGTDEAALPQSVAAATSDAGGAFEVRSLELGVYRISAQIGTRRSELLKVAVSEDRNPPLKLVLSDAEGVVVRVVNARGEALRAVHGWLLAPSPDGDGMPQTSTIETDAEAPRGQRSRGCRAASCSCS